MAARPGAQVQQPVGRAHGVLVVFHHDHGVPQVAEFLQRGQQLLVVPMMEPDRRLVEDVEHAGQLGADLGREPDALRLAARQRGGRALEREVAQPDVLEEPEARAQLLQDRRRDRGLTAGVAQAVRRCARDAHGLSAPLADVAAVDLDRQRRGLEAHPVTLGARRRVHEPRDPAADPLAILAALPLRTRRGACLDLSVDGRFLSRPRADLPESGACLRRRRLPLPAAR